MIMVARISNVHIHLYLVKKDKIKSCSCMIFKDEFCFQPLQRIGSKLSSDGIQKPSIVDAQETGVEWRKIDWNENRSSYLSYLRMMNVESETPSRVQVTVKPSVASFDLDLKFEEVGNAKLDKTRTS